MQCHKCATPIPDTSRFCATCGADVSGDSHGRSGDRTVAVERSDSEFFNRLQAELGTEYILERELGRGGMAIVFLGHDAHLKRKIAVKVLPPELAYAGGSMIERFKREAQTAAKLDHPNVIPVYRVAPGGTLVWYVMKFLEGESLDHILEREGQLTVGRTVDIVCQVATALDYAHQNQVVHRDVKPANVIVDKKGWCTVTDFGIAKALDANTLTASGSIIGTPYYMSPEQCKGKKVGPAADQYSLAVMTYQMLGGHVPFTGDSAVEIVHKHVADPIPPLGVLRPLLPEKVIQVVERGLSKNLEERFATVLEFATTLKAVAAGADIVVAPPVKQSTRTSKTALVSPVPGELGAARTPVPSGPTGSTLASPTPPSRLGIVLGAIGGGLTVGAIAIALVLKPWARAAPTAAVDTTARRDTVVAVRGGAGTTDPVAVASGSAADPATANSGGATRLGAATTARIVLRGVPGGATVTRNGNPVHTTAFNVTPGRQQVIVVSATRMEPWSDTVIPRVGDTVRLTVTLRPAAAVAGTGAVTRNVAGGARSDVGPAGLTSANRPGVASEAPDTGAALLRQGVQQPPAAAENGLISVGAPTGARIVINGRPVRNPAVGVAVPAGTVRLQCAMSDSSGQRTFDTVVTVRSGQHVRVGYIDLRRRPPQ